jgi:hypothetical protein
VTLAQATIVVPEHVVSRAFDVETVVLNLHTGTYHGLNATAARMFELLREHGSVPTVAEVLAGEFGRSASEVSDDLELLCADLAERDLLEIDTASDV